ncbi:uncharacterized protein FOKN1_1481 [Thiohalobacter thiocyanaticus]|uniref:AAA+ ATPase domain-containing protein n=1 Tax=Thiohalobacter thiocyanaticus TaxID=585455 RepID=A0A1Z4VQH9_9GAMM|nr:ATP-binding protein [Thiohalobacter thiocyanaticus]BAZ93877.1 uncharacterized protein FOKN1_1481 [Thiohalobacter thiocyanaticus]
MRIKSIHAQNTQPVELFAVNDLSDLVVIAGPNGIGKTRLISAFIAFFQNPNAGQIKFEIQSTSKAEEEAWGKRSLNTENAQDSNLLRTTLQQNRRRRNFSGSVLYYESNRTIQNIKPLSFQWEMADPWEEQVSWNFGFGGLAGRFQDTLHAIFKKIQNQKTSIANRAISLRQQGHDSMNLEFSDPLEPFRDAFSKLLGPKELVRADLQANTLRFRHNDVEYGINALSSGEREVLNIAFDFLLRRPSDCIIFFDEPELHLHPELSTKLISTLKSIGENNQFILCSHSPDIISSSLDDTVIFLTPKKEGQENQAVLLKADDESTEALNRLGHSIGVVSLGKKIVLIEGTDGSLDKQAYSHILKNRFPNLVLLPSGGKGNLSAFDKVADSVLNKTLWGIDFYMLADRDSIVNSDEFEERAPGRFRTLSKYHLENYFLDSDVLAAVFTKMEPSNSWLCDPVAIESRLTEIALNHLPYAATLIVANERRRMAGNVDIMVKGCQGKSKDDLIQFIRDKSNVETIRINEALNGDSLADHLSEVFDQLEKSVNDGSQAWKSDIPGKAIFKTFCSQASMPSGRLKTLYIQQTEEMDNNPFEELVDLFKGFAEHEA